MRAREKVVGAERFGVRHRDARSLELATVTDWEDDEDAAREVHAKCRANNRGCKFVRGVSYRLAPLVELPAWDSLRRGDHETRETFDADLTVTAAVVHATGRWIAVTEEHGGETRTEHATAAEARAACEARLRELGYRVAKGGVS